MEEIRKGEAATSRYTPTCSTESRASSTSDSESTPSVMEVTDGNDGALVAGIALAATMQSSVCTPETSHVGTNMAHSSTQENAHLTKQKRAGPRGEIEVFNSRLDEGLPPTKLLLRLTEQLLVQHIVSVEATFPSKALGGVQVQHVLRNCSTEVGEQPILFFCSL